jgi:hypothetical protein
MHDEKTIKLMRELLLESMASEEFKAMLREEIKEHKDKQKKEEIF